PAGRCRIATRSFVVPMKAKWGRLRTRRPTMRGMVLAKASEGMNIKMEGPPSREMLDAFAAMDRFTEELVKAGVFVAAAGLKNDAQARRVASDGAKRTVIDGPLA